jgi:hypothetical protein
VIVSLPRAPKELQAQGRCPWATIPAEVWPWVQAWRRWRYTGLTPLGASELGDEPASVSEAILACEETARQCERGEQIEAQTQIMGAMLGGGAR